MRAAWGGGLISSRPLVGDQVDTFVVDTRLGEYSKQGVPNDKENYPTRRQKPPIILSAMNGEAWPNGDLRQGGLDQREHVPTDILAANDTLAEEPLRQLLVPDSSWADQLLPNSTVLPANAIANPMMTCADHWLIKAAITIPLELAPVIKNRILQSTPDQNLTLPSDEWMSTMSRDDLVYLSKTGPKQDCQKALTLMNQLRSLGG